MVSSMAHKGRRSHHHHQEQQQQQTVALVATVAGLLIGVLVVPRAARRPLAVPGELLLRVSGAATLPLLACRLLLLPPDARLLAAALGFQLSASVAALLLASWAPTPPTARPAEPLDWFRACPIGALSLALRAADEEATWWRGAYLASVGLALHAVLVAVVVGAAASRRDLQRLLAALSWPLCVAAVAGSSWHALPAALCALQQREPTAAALVVVRCGSALCNMLLLTPTMLPDRGFTQGLLLAVANSLFSVGRGDGPLLYLAGLPPLPGAVYVTWHQ
ncbi:hypothetical protein HPB52_024157 [Rhipicephalus sanguineus]|uniref:Uncharacterized protein n=1 Tax=Rhipicephalus sanguineus TaxID=34632 RepID=A0A9D4T3G0_RHISA|nr:hypothetical protein HPB52_024157 [Rhipicephalus sanguineus]